MRYIIVDIEATCWKHGTRSSRMEIIEIGAVCLENGLLTDEFTRFIKPLERPKLSNFCIELTTIQQVDVDNADTFPQVFGDFLNWIGSEPFSWCSWGIYDYYQFKIDCQRHAIDFPKTLEQHIDIKQQFSVVKGIKKCGMKRALDILKIPLEGQHHRGIDDARNTAKIAMMILPLVETQE
jgi:inhibitor of KinA sporulation pathway (predicted exonuclease)